MQPGGTAREGLSTREGQLLSGSVRPTQDVMAKPRAAQHDGPLHARLTGVAMDLEFCWYEISPFVYTVSGGFLLGRADALLPVVSSVLLLTAGGTILFLRRRHALRTREEASALRTAVVRRG